MRLRSFFFAVSLLAACCLARAESGAMLALADGPLHIIRGAQMFKAVGGTLVQKDDIVETGTGGVQIELGADSIVALGPQTRVYLSALGMDNKAPAELALLQGWIKVLSRKTMRTLVATGALQISIGAGAAIVHSHAGKDELFADTGEQQAVRLGDNGKPGAGRKVPAESYAFADSGKALLLASKPASQFLAEMPLSFRDPLALGPPMGKAARQAAVREREVDFADVEAWLGSSLAVRKGFVRRFRGRLKDLKFRKALDQALGQGTEWQVVLHPPPPVFHPAR
jgi:hypothetical protein